VNYFEKADRVLKKLIGEGKKDFIIFPFGMRGMELKHILDQRYGIKERYIVDNGISSISKDTHIINLAELQERDISGITVLLANDNEKTFNELRSNLRKVIDKNKIVDVYSYSMYFDEEVYHEYNYLNYLGDVRFAALESAAREIYSNHVQGAIAECGVYKGDFAKLMARLMPDRTLYLFDTFEGFDERDNTGLDDSYLFDVRAKEQIFKDTSVELVLSQIGHQVDTIIRKGYFPKTTEGIETERFSLVSLDTDLYEPIMAGLEFFWVRLNPGGFIFIHDFGSINGVKKAVIEFCRREHIGYVRLPDNCHSVVLSKPL